MKPCCRASGHARCDACASVHRARCRRQYRRQRSVRIEQAQARRGVKLAGFEERWRFACGVAARRWKELYFAWPDVRQECAISAMLCRSIGRGLARSVDRRLYRLAKEIGGNVWTLRDVDFFSRTQSRL